MHKRNYKRYQFTSMQCFRNYYLMLKYIIPDNILPGIFKQESGKIHEHYEGNELLLQVPKTLSAKLHSVHPLVFFRSPTLLD